jgi:uncharacterized protein
MTIAVRAALALLLQLQIPAPTGYVNDFAGVIDPAAAARMTALITELHQKTGADIAVVTLPDLGGRSAADVAVQIGREWKLGGAGEAGDSAKNLGVVILLVPRKDHQPGTGDVFIATGRGAEGFLTDARVGRIRDAMLPALSQEDYSSGLETGTGFVTRAIADEFHVTITGAPAPLPDEEPSGFPIPLPLVFFLVIFLISLVSRMRGRRRWGIGPWFWTGGGWGGRGGWGGGGGGGGFSGGFGGFGGGGGFSGGGAGGRF